MFLKLSRFFLYTALFSVLIVLPTTASPFAGDHYFFRVAVESALACVVLWWGFEAPPGALRDFLLSIAADPLFRAVSVFTVAFLAACLFAYDRHSAFWSSYARGDGGFQVLHYYAFFILLLLLVDTAERWRLAMTLSVVAACFAVAYGILAAGLVPYFVGYLNTDGMPIAPTFSGRLLSGTRFMGSLGNPGYLAITLMFAMAFALYLAFTSPWKQVRGKLLCYGGVIFFMMVFFVLSQTRGPLLGLTAGTVSFFMYLALSEPRYRRRASAGLLVLTAIVVMAFSARDYLTRNDILGQRLLQLSLSDLNARARLWEWNAAWQGFKERPLTGWGPENFDVVFDGHFDPRMYIPGMPTDTWVDRAHSILFDYLAETGLVGLAAYAAIFAVFYVQFFQNLHRRRGGSDARHAVSPYTRALLFAMPVAYLVQGLLFFDVLPVYLNLFLFLALSTYWFRCRD